MNEKMPKVELRGKEYELQPLGLLVVYDIIDLVNKVGKKISEELGIDVDITKIPTLSKPVQIKIMMLVLKHSKEEVFQILSMVLGVEVEDLKDGSKFPPTMPITVFKKLWKEHPDIDTLKDDMGKLIEEM